ncbi:MAG TPA: hypothetical protein VII69_01210 [Candidatus Eremiobacteraceae bacterium]
MARAYNVFNAVRTAIITDTDHVISGGGIHVGPPKNIAAANPASPSFDFSFDLSPATDYDDLLAKILVKMLGGGRVKFDPNRNEAWSNHPNP